MMVRKYNGYELGIFRAPDGTVFEILIQSDDDGSTRL
jgi:hypothetical protein